jgi:hypothetical protein
MEITRAILESQNKHMEITRAVLENQDKLLENMRELWRAVRGLRSDVGGLAGSVGKLIEREIRYYLPLWIRENMGINVDRLRRFTVRGVVEFDAYAETEDKVIVAEIKATLRLRRSSP